MEYSLYCRAFKGVDAGLIARFFSQHLSSYQERVVFVWKTRGERQAKARFDSCVSEEHMEGLKGLNFREEAIKFELVGKNDEDSSVERKRMKKDHPPCIEKLCLPWLAEQVDYPEQLVRKESFVRDAMDKALIGVNKSARERGYEEEIFWSGLKKIDKTIFVPKSEGYRNKCEFTFGLNSEGHADIGFMLARATTRCEAVVAAGENLMHVPEGIARIVEKLRFILRENLDSFPLFSHVRKEGVWRLAAIRRCPLSEECQLLIQSGSSVEKEKFELLLKKFAEIEKINSLYVQYNASVTDTTVLSELHEMKLLFGSECIEMRVPIPEKSATQKNEKFVKFQVHPLSFFQTNTAACSLLYQRVADHLVGDESTVIDVCCGVGTIGQFIANSRDVGKVVGVDMVEEAIANAWFNAEANDLKTCEYFAGRAEIVLPRIIQENNFGENGQIIAVVDPPRVGLHKSVINAIRKHEGITRVIYVSCNPASLAQDLVKFCEPLTSCPEEEGVAVNKRFQPVSAVAVDMFPNTPHCEVVVLLTR